MGVTLWLDLRRPGYAALIGGEDWHYVGEAGEPAFENSWGSGQQAVAFRIRESGIVDIEGVASGGTPGTVIFTLPAGYRPSGEVRLSITGEISTTMSAGLLVVSTNGEVWGLRTPADQDRLYLHHQLFLVPATTP
jgi:hypothetical protein